MGNIWFAVGDIAEHTGFVSGPWLEEEAFPAAGGWTYQQITGPHGTVLHEGTREECDSHLAEWLRCDAREAGAYCYTHNPLR